MMKFLPAARRSVAARLAGTIALAGLFGATFALVACGPVGSGGTGAPVGGAAASSFAQGPINGFGTILVDGVHYDDATALVVDDDGRVLSAQADLHLGSTVDVEGDPVAGNVVTATLIRVHVDLVGPVTSVFDPTTHALGVLGQVVDVDPSTTFIDGIAGGLPGLARGDVVEVSSMYDAIAGVYHATRIAPRAGTTAFTVRGAVSALGAGSVQIGAQSFDYGTLASQGDFQAGQILRLTLSPQPTDLGHWTVTAIASGVTLPPDRRTGDLRGAVGKVIDAHHAFVAGVLVDASAARLVPADQALERGALVVAHGTMAGAVLVASRIDFPVPGYPSLGIDDTGEQSRYATAFEIDGRILSTLDVKDQTFVMRGPTTVDWSHAAFLAGSAADLAEGRMVDVEGALSADGTRLVATSITIAN
jgi:hypothetical protein